MKLFLTSAGIKTVELRSALLELAGAPVAELSLAFIPTAANLRDEDKSWLIDDLHSFRTLGLRKIDIVDIAAVSREQFAPRLEQANILVFGGGSTEFLLSCMRERGLTAELAELLSTRVLVGISAGSVMCCPVINPKQVEGLHYVDFLFVPHMGSHFARRSRADVQKFADLVNTKAYWVDDHSGILVRGNELRLIGSGVELVEPQFASPL